MEFPPHKTNVAPDLPSLEGVVEVREVRGPKNPETGLIGTRRLTPVQCALTDTFCHEKAAPARLTACRTTWHLEFLTGGLSDWRCNPAAAYFAFLFQIWLTDD